MNRISRNITYGDRIFARVTRNGHTILDFVTEKVSSMTELLAQLRTAMKGIKGLVMLHIRNYHKGWGEERPLMLYQTVSVYRADHSRGQDSMNDKNSSRKMFSPWEIH